jgi:hypothetical protein
MQFMHSLFWDYLHFEPVYITYLLFHSFHPVCVALISTHNVIREECLGQLILLVYAYR